MDVANQELGASSVPVLPYGGTDVWTRPQLQGTPAPYVQPGAVGGVPPGPGRISFYPAEDAYSPGDSMNIRPTLPDSAPYFQDRRAVDMRAPGVGMRVTDANRLPLIGLGAFVLLVLVSEHFRPKGKGIL